MITREAFMKRYNISEELFQSAGMSWEELCSIYEDFETKKSDKYEKIRENFYNSYLKNIDRGKEDVKVHSICSRVKDSEHLIAKIVRKKQENQRKYGKLDKNNYEKFITDLIGIRCLVLFKSDWQSFHQYIVSKFEDNAKYYIKDSIQDFDDNENHFYIAEKPKVHIRNGDPRDIYDEMLSPDSIIDGKVYRSVHYIIKYEGVYLEIQVRTLFEEGWGEIDHTVVYPYYQDDEILKGYTELLNRLSGLADEMGSFFKCLRDLEMKVLERKHAETADILNETSAKDIIEDINQKEDGAQENNEKQINTPFDCLQTVLDE